MREREREREREIERLREIMRNWLTQLWRLVSPITYCLPAGGSGEPGI
jgi:hypothetical protein